MSTQQERFSGTLLGAAVAGALRAKGGSHNLQCGAYTDDAAIMVCVAESLVERGEYYPKDITRKLMAWCRKTSKENPTNGSVVRCVPLSLYFRDEEPLIQASREVASATHSHAEAEFINVMIARLLAGDKRKDAYIRATEKTGGLDHGFVGSFMIARSFEEAVARAFHLGGDDVAVAGALAGAYFGRPGIPRRWSRDLKFPSSAEPKLQSSAKYIADLGKALFKSV